MHDFLKFHHNFYACIGVQKERKRTFLTAFEHREKRLAACLLHNIFIAVVSECLCHPVQLPDIRIDQQILDFYHPCVSDGATVLYALLALNAIQTVLLQLKIFPCDSA